MGRRTSARARSVYCHPSIAGDDAAARRNAAADAAFTVDSTTWRDSAANARVATRAASIYWRNATADAEIATGASTGATIGRNSTSSAATWSRRAHRAGVPASAGIGSRERRRSGCRGASVSSSVRSWAGRQSRMDSIGNWRGGFTFLRGCDFCGGGF